MSSILKVSGWDRTSEIPLWRELSNLLKRVQSSHQAALLDSGSPLRWERCPSGAVLPLLGSLLGAKEVAGIGTLLR